MQRFMTALCALALFAVAAAPALADGSARDVQAALDSYLANDTADVALVGGPGSAGYDNGFWIRGGDFLLRANVTLQARFEAMDYDESQPPEQAGGGIVIGAGQVIGPDFFGGDLSGFSLPRATLKLSGEAPCNIRWYMELEFGHFGRDVVEFYADNGGVNAQFLPQNSGNLGSAFAIGQSHNYDNTREAWIEWGCSDALNFRMGQIALPTTRQLMVKPELQQFVDISLASAFVGQILPGYTDRNRDHGLMIHGAFGCNSEWSYMLAISNGDGGDSIRNVLDHRTSDGLAFSGRVNWAFAKPIGYQEGALAQETCGWYGEIGAWGFVYADRIDKNHTVIADSTRFGVDLALGWGGFSFTGAYTMGTDEQHILAGGSDLDMTAWLAQIGYHFPGTAWELAARASSYDLDPDMGGGGATTELAFAINYYLNGHGNKFTVDISFFEGNDPGSFLIWDAYTGIGGWAFGEETFGTLLRFQWQLAL
ncbi:MAG: porin [Planctomycetota bacterium]